MTNIFWKLNPTYRGPSKFSQAQNVAPPRVKNKWRILTNVYTIKKNSPKTPLAVSALLTAWIRTKLIYQSSTYNKYKLICGQQILEWKLNNCQAKLHLEYTEINIWPTYFGMESKLCIGLPWIWFALHHKKQYRTSSDLKSIAICEFSYAHILWITALHLPPKDAPGVPKLAVKYKWKTLTKMQSTQIKMVPYFDEVCNIVQPCERCLCVILKRYLGLFRNAI